MNNILLVGQRHVGKTTIVRSVLKAVAVPTGGFVTEPIFSGEKITGYSIGSLNGIKAVFAHEILTGDYQSRTFTVESGALNKIGSLILTQAQRNANVIFMDELNNLMDNAEEFQRRINRCLDGEIPVLVVMDNEPSAFMELIASRKDVLLRRVTPQTRNLLVSFILEKLDSWGIPVSSAVSRFPEKISCRVI
jgi:nucleoside-triphosphatase THEP1